MESRIFDQKLSVEATSLFLLIESLSDSGTRLGRDDVARFWNASSAELDGAFAELASRNIAGDDPSGGWRLKPFADWKRPS